MKNGNKIAQERDAHAGWRGSGETEKTSSGGKEGPDRTSEGPTVTGQLRRLGWLVSACEEEKDGKQG